MAYGTCSHYMCLSVLVLAPVSLPTATGSLPLPPRPLLPPIILLLPFFSSPFHPFFWGKISLCSLGCSETYDPLASAFQVLGLEVLCYHLYSWHCCTSLTLGTAIGGHIISHSSSEPCDIVTMTPPTPCD